MGRCGCNYRRMWTEFAAGRSCRVCLLKLLVFAQHSGILVCLRACMCACMCAGGEHAQTVEISGWQHRGLGMQHTCSIMDPEKTGIGWLPNGSSGPICRSRNNGAGNATGHRRPVALLPQWSVSVRVDTWETFCFRAIHFSAVMLQHCFWCAGRTRHQ